MKGMRQTENENDDWRDLWAELKARLAAKLEALNDEVRAYPTPIARCDDQLPKLLDRRAALQRLVRRADDQAEAALTDAQFVELVEELTRDDEDDAQLAALRERARGLLTE